jgi:D-alanyl-D-alanine carboxypeptidase (penicillin-binding protein 5/6)
VTARTQPGRTAYSLRGLSLVAASLLTAVGVLAGGVAAEADTTPPPPAAATPGTLSVVTRTDSKLPKPTRSLDPALTVGGPRLATMGLVIDRPPTVPAPPGLPCVAWLLADMDTGDVLAAQAPHALLLPASALKTLTGLVTLPKVDAAKPYKATDADARADGTRVGMVPGLTYTGRDLFNAMIMSSANDAAYALARISGGVPVTLEEMNAEAAWLGAHDTTARDPAGLDAPGQLSSPYDLALFGRAAMQLPEFRAYAVRKQVAFPGAKKAGGKRGSFMISNHDKMLYNYPGTIGVKNGYTVAAHQTLISAVNRGGKTYVLTEMYGTNGSWRPTAAMFDWAFAHGSAVTPVGRLVEPGEVPVAPGQEASGYAATTSPPTAGATEAAGPVAKGRSSVGFNLAALLGDFWPVGSGVGTAALAVGIGLVIIWQLVRRRRRRRGYTSRHRA